MTENRRFLLDDIIAMLPQSKDTQWLYGLNDDGLYHLWRDLVNLTLTEDLTWHWRKLRQNLVSRISQYGKSKQKHLKSSELPYKTTR
ncbi:hypothetical protein DCBHLPFO_00768 [Mycoplasmopsis arginini]|uniref:Uncharacterized protein n=1 Tax=Mycoplasmopsis arginini TaxID=2094 RepID=A0AA43TZT4_MYCAR|nr:hypothetical protein [Mycoplasmopsis arginini]